MKHLIEPPLRKSDKVLLAMTVCAMLYSGLAILEVESRDVIAIKPPAEETLCLIETIQSGESISEEGPGDYNYSLIVTSRGIEVYKDCDDSE